MKSLMTKLGITLATLTLGLVSVLAQDGATVASPHSEAAGGLDLYAVAELFRTSETLEKFEESLNHSETGINNLDLDQNGEVDFIRVTERVVDDTHLIVLQNDESRTRDTNNDDEDAEQDEEILST